MQISKVCTKTLIALPFVYSLSLPVQAGTDLIIGGWSYHDDRKHDYNETHYNLGVKVNDWSLMYYKNSNYKDTVMLGYDYLPLQYGNLKLGGVGVIGTGYSDGEQPVVGGFLKASYQYKKLGVDLHWMPTVVTQIQFRYVLSDTYNGYDTGGKTDWAASYGYGVLGGSANIYYHLNDKLTLRGYLTGGSYKWDDMWDHWNRGVSAWQQEYLKPRFYGINLDYHPWDGMMTLYAGVGYNDSQYKTKYNFYSGQGCGTVNINHEPVEVCHESKLYGDVEFDKLSGSFGVRWGNPFAFEGQWGWYVDLGAHTLKGITGEATFVGEGTVTEDQLNAFERKEELKYDKYNLAPRLDIGVSWRF